jgi:hypothetical protein
MCFGSVAVGAGVMAGVSKTNTIVVLNSNDAVKVFCSKGQIKFGADLQVTAGPIGREAGVEINGGDAGYSISPSFSYSHSVGLFAGVYICNIVFFMFGCRHIPIQCCTATGVGIDGTVVVPRENDNG